MSQEDFYDNDSVPPGFSVSEDELLLSLPGVDQEYYPYDASYYSQYDSEYNDYNDVFESDAVIDDIQEDDEQEKSSHSKSDKNVSADVDSSQQSGNKSEKEPSSGSVIDAVEIDKIPVQSNKIDEPTSSTKSRGSVSRSSKSRSSSSSSRSDYDPYEIAQKGLIASLLYDDIDADRVLEVIDEDDFSVASYREIMASIARLIRSDEAVSVTTVGADLEQHGRLKNVGGLRELFSLRVKGEAARLEATPSTYARIIREYSSKETIRQALKEAQKTLVGDSGVSASQSISEIQDTLNQELLKLSDDSKTVSVANFVEDYDLILDERKRLSEENKELGIEGLQGIPTLVPSLNKFTGGFMPGQFITVAARTGVGKSVFAVMQAIAAAEAGYSVMFFSLEMSHEEIVNRIVANMSGVPLNKLKSGLLSDEDRQKVFETTKRLRELKIHIDTDDKISIDTIRSKAQKQATSPDGLDMIIVDYLQLVSSPRRYTNRQEEVASISKDMKRMARALGIPVMSLAQLNRKQGGDDDGEDVMPTLDNIRESHAIAQDSDVIILLHRDTKTDYTVGITKIILAKQRDGVSNKIINCHSNLANSMFREIKKEKDVSHSDFSDDDLESESDYVGGDGGFDDDLDDFDEFDSDDDDFGDIDPDF